MARTGALLGGERKQMPRLHNLCDDPEESAQMFESGSQDRIRVDLTPDLRKACRGDAAAFDRLMKRLTPNTLHRLMRQGATDEDAEDALSETMIIVHRLLQRQRFEEVSTGGFVAYFYQVAYHEWLHCISERRQRNETLSVYEDPITGDHIGVDFSDPNPSPEHRVPNKILYDFFREQLVTVFVFSRTDAERMRGELEMLAFLYFYQDGLTQNEIFEILLPLSQAFPDQPPLTLADLNNWLSMGRSLKAVLKHLAEHHFELMDILLNLHLEQLNLPSETKQVMRLYYSEGLTLTEIAARLGSAAPSVRRTFYLGKKPLIDALTRTIKGQLKRSRSA